MKKLFLLALLPLFLASCGSSRRVPKNTINKPEKVLISNDAIENIVDHAKRFEGTRYKFGGTTKKGMDCSGLLYVSFADHDIKLPRTSYHMAEEGTRIKVKDVQKGDLLFFRTSRGAKRINHVGMVVATENEEITFIHASTSRGVTVSSLRDGFWNNAFVKATRIL